MDMDEIDFKGKTVLVVGAHPDDNDFGAGATVAKAARQGAKEPEAAARVLGVRLRRE